MRIAIYTLGCKVNQYETQAMETILRQRGHSLVDFESPADAYIINTCTVTAVSDKKSRQAIRRARRMSPNGVVAVCGCYAQTTPEAVEELDVDLISGTGDRLAFLDDLEQAVRGKQQVHVDAVMSRRSFEFLPAEGWPAAPGACSRWRTAASTSAPTAPSLRPGPGALPAPGAGGLRGPADGIGGIPGNCPHRH